MSATTETIKSYINAVPNAFGAFAAAHPKTVLIVWAVSLIAAVWAL